MSTQTLATWIDVKRQTLRQLRALAVRQMATVQSGGGGLISLLAAKQKLLDQLVDIERQLDPFRREDPDARRWSSPAERAACAEAAQECNTLLSELMQLEKQAIDMAQSQQNAARQDIHTAHACANARAAYAAGATTFSTNIDFTSDA